MPETLSNHTHRIRPRSAARSLVDLLLMRPQTLGRRTTVVNNGIAPPPVVTAAEATCIAHLAQRLAGAKEHLASLNHPKPDMAFGL